MIVDLFLVYQFIKRLATPFNEWKAYELGIIDERGNQLKKIKELRTREEKQAFGRFDLLISKLKKLIEKVPGGKSRIGTYAAALFLIKEHDELNGCNETLLTEGYLEEKLNEYMISVERLDYKKDINALFETVFSEDAPANSAGSGNIAGIGVGPDGEPGVTKQEQEKIRKRNKTAVLTRIQKEKRDARHRNT